MAQECETFPYFYPRSPCGERHTHPIGILIRVVISIHALLAESDKHSANPKNRKQNFYPRSPCGERLAPMWGNGFTKTFLSTLSLRRATDQKSTVHAPVCISIHALLAESDFGKITSVSSGYNFYPRSPCGERHNPKALKSRRMVFLSTLSLRRATSANCSCRNARPDFYPRSPCGERRTFKANHLLRGTFLSTLSLRRATGLAAQQLICTQISIHALLAESDPDEQATTFVINISIHALLAESDTPELVINVR